MEDAFFHRAPEQQITIPELAEVSAGLHREALPVFLWEMIQLVQEDFGPEQVRQLIETADGLQLNEARRVAYRVTFRGRRIDFRIILYRYEPDTIGLYVKGPWGFTSAVQKHIEKFLGQRKPV